MGNVSQSGRSFYLSWTLTPPEPVRIFRTQPDEPNTELATELPATTTFYIDVIDDIAAGTTVEYSILGLTSAGNTIVSLVAGSPDEVPYTYGPVDYLLATHTYGSAANVKQRLGITDTDWDTEIDQALLSAETAMNGYWGRSLPDTGTNPEWPGIPQQVRQAAENIAVAILKQIDAPFGVAGSDILLGELDLQDQVTNEINRSRLLRGFRRGWGVG